MNCFESQIDLTRFGTVRRWFLAAGSPVKGVLLVAQRELLPSIAQLLAGADQRRPRRRQFQLERWILAGQLQMGGDPTRAPQGFVVDLDAIADDTPCDVIFLPPYYLVCLREAPCTARVRQLN